MTVLTCQIAEAVAAYKEPSISLIDGQVLDRIHTTFVSAHRQTPNFKPRDAITFHGAEGHKVTLFLAYLPPALSFLPSFLIA